jgi:hypothetical protein
MNHHRMLEIAVASILLFASLLLVNPFHVWMPSMFHMSMLAVVVTAAGGIAAFMLREKQGDERDDAHRMHAGRWAFFAGSTILLAGITIQTFAHALDPWLVYALLGMVCAKVSARSWSERNR